MRAKRNTSESSEPRFISIVVVAAGSGKRFGKECPKQFTPLDGVPILIRTLKILQKNEDVSELILVLPHNESHGEPYSQERLRDKYALAKLSAVVTGGKERFFSVRAGISAVNPEATLIGIHDGVRPFVNKSLMTRLIRTATKFDTAVPAIKVDQTLKRALATNDEIVVDKTLDRSHLYLVQTPQFFSKTALVSAYAKISLEKGFAFPTDDAEVLEWQGLPVHLCEGDKFNIKITWPDDLVFAECILKSFPEFYGI